MRVKMGFVLRSIHADFITVLGDLAHSYPSVARWVTSIKEGIYELEADESIGLPVIMANQANIELVRAVIEANPFSAYYDIQAETSLCQGSINHIIHIMLEGEKNYISLGTLFI